MHDLLISAEEGSGCTSHPSVEIIVPVYNEPDLASTCLDSVCRYTLYPNWTLTVVDDASDSFTRAFLDEHAARTGRIRVLHNDENLGFVGANNRALRTSDADYVLLLNSDVVVTPGWLTKMVAVAESDSTIAMVNPFSNEFVNLSLPMAPGASFLTMNDLLSQRDDEPFDIVTAVAYCLLVRREALREVGVFDEVYGRGYCEDTDLHMRMTSRGWRVVGAPNTYVYHKGSATFSPEVMWQRYEKNIEVFRSRWGTQYDRDYQQFIEEGRLKKLRSSFVPEPVPQVERKPSFVRVSASALRIAVQQRRQLLAMAARPRHTLARLRRGFVSDAVAIASSRAARPVEFQGCPRQDAERFCRSGAPSLLFVTDTLPLCGGTLRVVELINQLILLGVDARLAVVDPNNISKELLRKAYFSPLIYRGFSELIEKCPRSDVAVATFWTTARHVRTLLDHGRVSECVYYLQDFEAWFYSDSRRMQQEVLSTYSLIAHRIATSRWLQGLLAELGFESTSIPYGFNTLEFYPLIREPRPVERIIAMARPETPYRGFDILAESLRRVHHARPDVEIALFGSQRLQQYRELDFPFINLGFIHKRSDLMKQYNDAGIFVDTSHFQGFGVPAVEAMACGLACVLSDNGGVHEYARHGENALLVSTKDVEAFSAAIVQLIDNRQLRRHFGIEGRKTVEKMSLETEAQRWTSFVSGISKSFRGKLEGVSPHELQSWWAK